MPRPRSHERHRSVRSYRGGYYTLVGRLARSPAFMPAFPVVRQRSLGVRRGAADGVAIIGPSSPTAALAVPHEGGRLAVPGAGRLLEPDADLGRARGVLPLESAPLEDALDRFGHVQPAAAQRR